MAVPDHRNLPLRDYDHLPLASLAQRIRSLSAGELTQLLRYEQDHANRPAAVQAFEARLSELAAGQSPTGGRGQTGPDWPGPPSGGSPAGPETAGRPGSAPPHGNPAQPARPEHPSPNSPVPKWSSCVTVDPHQSRIVVVGAGLDAHHSLLC